MTDTVAFNRLIAAEVLPTTALDVLSGKRTEADALAGVALRQGAAAILTRALKDRPRPALAWDLGAAHWHRSLDHSNAEAFAADYPGAAVFSVDRAELVAALSNAARRRAGPWSEPYRSKTARLVAHLEAGGLVTPPLVVPVLGGLALAGGYHRLGWAHFRRARKIPILLERSAATKVVGRLTSLADDGGASVIAA